MGEIAATEEVPMLEVVMTGAAMALVTVDVAALAVVDIVESNILAADR